MYNVYIRPLSEEDAKISYKWRNDPEVWRFTGSRPNREITYEIELEWITKVLSDESCKRFAIVVDEKYIGNIQLTNINNESAEYHIFIGDKNWWGKGISHLATYQILHFAKEELKLNEVYLSVSKDNISAVKSYLKSGFIQTAEEEDWIKMKCLLAELPPPTVSVFTLVYNHQRYLKDCLNGILMQKCNFNFVAVVGEDCSTDKSRDILLEYQKKFPGKFKLILQDKNVGAHANQEQVLKSCRGKYNAMCEGDDYWIDDNKIQYQVDFMEKNSDFSMCCHNAYIIKENGVLNKKFNNYKTSQELSINKIMNDWIIPTASILFRRESLPTLPSWAKEIYSGDYTLALLLAYKGKIMFLNKFSSIYRITTNSSSATSIYSKKPFFILDQHRFLLKKFNEESEGKYAGLIKKRLKHIDNEERFIKFYMKGKLLPLIFTPLTALKKIFKKINF